MPLIAAMLAASWNIVASKYPVLFFFLEKAVGTLSFIKEKKFYKKSYKHQGKQRSKQTK
jgi:hypothetical protein